MRAAEPNLNAITFDGVLDVEQATIMADLAIPEEGAPLVIDLRAASRVHDAAIVLLQRALEQRGRRVAFRGLSRHHAKLLAMLRGEPGALEEAAVDEGDGDGPGEGGADAHAGAARERLRREARLLREAHRDAVTDLARELLPSLEDPLTAVIANVAVVRRQLEGLPVAAREAWAAASGAALGELEVALADAREAAHRMEATVTELTRLATRR